MDGSSSKPAGNNVMRKVLPPLRPRMRSGLTSRGVHRPFVRPEGPKILTTQDKRHEGPKPMQQRKKLLLPDARPDNAPHMNGIQHAVDRNDSTIYFAVLYTKRSRKKHKTYQDGIIIVKNDRKVELQNEEGKKISSISFGKPLGGLKDGNTLEIGTYELEVQNNIPADAYLSGELFLQTPKARSMVSSIPLKSTRQFKSVRPNNPLKSVSSKEPRPLHDPSSENAILLQTPYACPSGKKTVPIVLDPVLSRRMRPHQHEGVKFLYNCVEGAASVGERECRGAILADSMGLGKSLQAIAVAWTLLKQGPFGKPLAKKAIIVCPASLVQNWVNEVKKWLGFERLKPVALMSGKSSFECLESVADFLHGNLNRLLIVSYEMFRSYCDELYQAGCGILICDEGHRLKSSGGNKTITALNKIPCKRRIILTGTPVQNDLDELFAMCNFVNPGLLGSLGSFRTIFAKPIIMSRDTNASKTDLNIGQARAKELQKQVSRFVLQRSSSILEKYLPNKTETAVFCQLSDYQSSLYTSECEMFFTAAFPSSAAALIKINRLRKLCSHPSLLDNDKTSGKTKMGKECLQQSSKLSIAMSICRASIDVGDRLVMVSNFTSTLGVLEEALRACKISFTRLDGSTPAHTRGDLVRRFNNRNDDKVFLLSAKAGGVGLNIIGANRLILFDPDWNPATDLQAMARIWRDGQSKPVFVYRLLATGTIEEKIFQRQLFKGELQVVIDSSNDDQCAVDSFGSKISSELGRDVNFSASELRNLFHYDGNNIDLCDTLRVLERSHAYACREDDSSINQRGDLLSLFVKYRDQLEAMKPVIDVVQCSGDDVLSVALNSSNTLSGKVSYLYSTRSGDHLLEKRKPPYDLAITRSKKLRKVSYVDSDSSEDVHGELLKEVGDSKVLEPQQPNIYSSTYRPIVDLCEENSYNDADVVFVSESKVQSVPSTKTQNPAELTWDNALDEINDENLRFTG